MILRPYGVPAVYRLRATSRSDSYGDAVEDWTSPERVRLTAAVVQNDSTEEDEGVVRRVLTDRKRLYVSGVADLRADDRVEAEGVVYRVDGEPETRLGLTRAVYTTAALVRMT